MRKAALLAPIAVAALLMAGAGIFADDGNDSQQKLSPTDSGIRDYAARQVREGRLRALRIHDGGAGP